MHTGTFAAVAANVAGLRLQNEVTKCSGHYIHLLIICRSQKFMPQKTSLFLAKRKHGIHLCRSVSGAAC